MRVLTQSVVVGALVHMIRVGSTLTLDVRGVVVSSSRPTVSINAPRLPKHVIILTVQDQKD